MTKPRDDDYSKEEARRRFEKAVDVALHTPPMHRGTKSAKKVKSKTKSGKKA